jgi:hypothetical protein
MFVDVIPVSAVAIKMASKKLENNFLVSTLEKKLLVFLVNYAYYATLFCYEKVR